jgi:hypothetical protein
MDRCLLRASFINTADLSRCGRSQSAPCFSAAPRPRAFCPT